MNKIKKKKKNLKKKGKCSFFKSVKSMWKHLRTGVQHATPLRLHLHTVCSCSLTSILQNVVINTNTNTFISRKYKQSQNKAFWLVFNFASRAFAIMR